MTKLTDTMPQEWTHDEVCDGDQIFGQTIDGIGRFTVLDRMTGWGNGQRDTETGFSDPEGKFWLVSGMFDIRHYPELTVAEAIAKIKELANTCVGE